MTTTHKSESPAVTGHVATNQSTVAPIFTPSEIQGNAVDRKVQLIAALDSRKRVATIKAECAMRGYQVHETADGFLVTRWGLSRHCADLEALHCFARQIGASE